MERMKTQVELLKESCDIKDAACVRYQKRIAELEEENKKLKEKIDELEKCNLNLQERLDRKEEVNKKLREELSAYDREYFDEDKKASEIYKEYQHSMGFSDFGGYDEDEHIVKDENTYRDLDL